MVMKNYPPEFKADAVALVLSRPDRTITSIARDLGVSRETLRVWVRAAQARGEGGPRAAGGVGTGKDTPAGPVPS
ncbi:transposase, partial [Nonomuraea sp. NPDC004297]